MCWLSCSPTALPEQDNPVSFQTSESPTCNCLHRHRLFSLVHSTWISCLQGEAAVKIPQQLKDPRGTASATGQILTSQLCAQALTPKGPKGGISRATTGTASLSPHPKGHRGSGQEREALPKLFTLLCPRGRLPEQRVPCCLLLDVLYLTWQWAVPWQYPICSPLSWE